MRVVTEVKVMVVENHLLGEDVFLLDPLNLLAKETSLRVWVVSDDVLVNSGSACGIKSVINDVNLDEQVVNESAKDY